MNRMQDGNWWRDFIVPVPRPIPRGYMVGMRDEWRDGRLYIVEFLEKVPEYQPNPTRRTRGVWETQVTGDDEGDTIVAWSREEGFTVIDSEPVQGEP